MKKLTIGENMVDNIKIQTISQLKNRIIEEGIESCKKDCRLSSYEIEGSIEGFNITRDLNSPEDFINILQKRHEEELKLMYFDDSEKDVEDYWRYRYTTLQIEFVWERMKIAWKISGPIKASAIIHYADLVQ